MSGAWHLLTQSRPESGHKIVIREASMYRSDEEKLTDVVIGEAVLTLLKSDSPVSSTALIAQLEVMAAAAEDAKMARAIKGAVTEVRKGMAAASKRSKLDFPDRENITHRFNSEGPPEGSKKH
jgi:hypothetical protein